MSLKGGYRAGLRPLCAAAALALCLCAPRVRAEGEDKPKDPPSQGQPAAAASGPTAAVGLSGAAGRTGDQEPAAPKSKWGVETGDKDLDKKLDPSEAAKKGDVEALKDLLKKAQANKIKGIPEGWDIDKDQFLQKLLEGSGDKKAIIKDGELKGIQVERDGKTFVYTPKAQYAVQLDGLGGPGGMQILRLQDGRLQARALDSLAAGDREVLKGQLYQNRERLQGAIRDGRAGQNFLYDLGRSIGAPDVRIGGAPGSGTPPSGTPAPAPQGRDARPPESVPSGGLDIANNYMGKPPDKLKGGQLYWDGKDLKVAKAVDASGKVTESRSVGYMARLQDVDASQRERIIFWHGGAEPDAAGMHDKSDSAWALFSVEKGQEASKGTYLGSYYGFDLRNSQGQYSTAKGTDGGTRLQLWTALKNEGLNSYKDGKVSPLFEGQKQLLFSFRGGTPFDGGTLRNLIAFDGKKYVDGQFNGQMMVFMQGSAPPPPPPSGPRLPAPDRAPDGTIRLKPGDLDRIFKDPLGKKDPPMAGGPRGTPGPTTPGSPSNLRLVDVPKVRDFNGSGYSPVARDIISHTRQPYFQSGPTTNAHESMHGANSDVGNAAGGNGRTGLYLGDGKGIVFEQPRNLTLGQAGQYVPGPLRDDRFNLYFGQQRQYFENQPLYILDEWVAYGANGAEALALAKNNNYRGGGSDEMAGGFEFTIYALAVGRAAQAKDPQYWQSSQLKDFLQWNAERTMNTFKEGRVYPQFNTTAQGSDWNRERAWRTLRESNDPGVQSLRQFAIDNYGADWTQRVFGFSWVRYQGSS